MPHPSKKSIVSVAELNAQIRDVLQTTFSNVWVAGEITDASRPSSGHLYFSLKDATGSIKAITWRTTLARIPFEPHDGMRVLCRGSVDVYAPRGTYQLIVQQMQLQGEGELQAALRQLREKLQAEGLFDPARKRALPKFAKRLAVVTSPSGAALRDFLETVRRRWSDCQFTIVPTRVQGLDVGPEIAAAIRRVFRMKPAVDAILVTRGGGSLEDLWGFNEEVVVRAIHDSPVPVVSAIGHEIDVTLADLVADVRALTPSHAGELMVPDASEWTQRLKAAKLRMNALLRARFDHAESRVVSLAENRVLRDPFAMLRDRERMLDDLQQRAARAIRHQTERSSAQLRQLVGQLETLSPLHVLSRGYSLTQTTGGDIVRSVDQLAEDDEIRIRLAKGEVSAIVQRLEAEAPPEET